MKHKTRRIHRAVIVALSMIALFNSAIAPMSNFLRAASVASATADPNGANNSATTITTVQ